MPISHLLIGSVVCEAMAFRFFFFLNDQKRNISTNIINVKFSITVLVYSFSIVGVFFSLALCRSQLLPHPKSRFWLSIRQFYLEAAVNILCLVKYVSMKMIF